MNWLDRQSFLGENSHNVLSNTVVGLAGLGGGGSHMAQQFAHVGVGSFIVFDNDIIDETNLNRLVGGRYNDIAAGTEKVEIARRMILDVNPKANVYGKKTVWQAEADRLMECDIIIGCLDSIRAKNELEGFCRRFLIPYIDLGMDVHAIGDGHLIAGQVALSMPSKPCLQCMGVIRQDALDEEGRNYGAAGGKPQVIWPNGVLASSAVGLVLQLVTPWHRQCVDSIYLEYDGNLHTVVHRKGMGQLYQRGCPHYPENETGDPGFDVRKWIEKTYSTAKSFAGRSPRISSMWDKFLKIFG